MLCLVVEMHCLFLQVQRYFLVNVMQETGFCLCKHTCRDVLVQNEITVQKFSSVEEASVRVAPKKRRWDGEKRQRKKYNWIEKS